MKNDFELMKKCPLFSNLSEEELNFILTSPHTKIKDFSKNQTVISEGDSAEELGAVLSGAVQIVRNDYYGNRSIIALIEPPQIFAEVFVFSDTQHMPVSVVSAGDSRIMLIRLKSILNESFADSSFYTRQTNNLLRLVAEKNLKLNEKIEIISKRTIREKLMTFLLSQAKLHGSDTFTIPYDRQELADFLEANRSAVSAEISRLRAEGIIESKRSSFRLIRKSGE
ncbi:Crp/Fnr family transcriptional regulator [Ruminococcus sp. Marseille-P6503]|uniref:Crp/Fnr family transcriptional regulator n=1 Tax=Ruminococcus sp. Marseille-P6503 TaxID=2364796 RepID=UPI000F538A63|nr:Crp/Fnr family transcriptional regulator [Ruminococcus sp. Marseille-P6503]